MVMAMLTRASRLFRSMFVGMLISGRASGCALLAIRDLINENLNVLAGIINAVSNELLTNQDTIVSCLRSLTSGFRVYGNRCTVLAYPGS
jgi:hypothetical protein